MIISKYVESVARIYLAGDIHGELEIGKVMHYFEREAQSNRLTEKDYLILLGDVGLCWDGGSKDLYVRSCLESLPVTDWNGGKVQYTGNKIIHLMRGYIYDICGKSIFVFGGGFLIDKIYRKEGISWWAREMPSEEEYERGRKNLASRGNRVDYIITHTVPRDIAKPLVHSIYPEEEALQYFLQDLALNVDFEKWYFGHWHIDKVLGKFVGVYDEIVTQKGRR